VDAVCSRLVRRGGHHLPRLGRVAAAAHHDRAAAQLRAAQQLDRGHELVEVDVQQPPPRRHMVTIRGFVPLIG
jgi:hypothetical protein